MRALGRWRAFRAWILGAAGWCGVSLVVMLEYLAGDDAKYVDELWLVLSLLWWQFGFAGIFTALRHYRYRDVPLLVLVTLLPSLVLYAVIRLLA